MNIPFFRRRHIELLPRSTRKCITSSSSTPTSSRPSFPRRAGSAISGSCSWLLVGVVFLLGGLVLASRRYFGHHPAGPDRVRRRLRRLAGRPLAQRHGLPRAAGAALVLLGADRDRRSRHRPRDRRHHLPVRRHRLVFENAAEKVEGWLTDAGVDSSGASSASETTKDSVSAAASHVHPRESSSGIEGMASLALGLSFAALSLFFLLKDGPVHARVGRPSTWASTQPVARTITGNVIVSLRRYFGGVTIVAAFNGVVVGLGALVLGVPLAATIALVTLRDRLHPVRRGVRGRRLRGRARTRLRRTDGRDHHAGDRPARERPAPEHPPADRVRGDARARTRSSSSSSPSAPAPSSGWSASSSRRRSPRPRSHISADLARAKRGSS